MEICVPSAERGIDSCELSTALNRLKLGQYEERLRENGFEDWETVTAVTEADLVELGFKLGDRRKLQQAIREGSASHLVGDRNILLSSDGLLAALTHIELTPPSLQQAAHATRPYRRHPRPDPNAPRKPKTAYVLFGEHVRQDPALGRSSFVDIAKEQGKRWRDLSVDERLHSWETPAADRLQDYKDKLKKYKQTEDYRAYQTYLEEFKRGQHGSGFKTPSQDEASLVYKGQQETEITLQGSLATKDSYLESQWQDKAAPVKSGMEEVHHTLRSLGIHHQTTRVASIPQENLTKKAVDAFLRGTGTLLFLWGQDEALNLMKFVYHPQRDSTPVYATEVLAMSAVGSYCDGEAHTMLIQEKLFHLFLCMLSSPSDMSDLRYMRLFACLAICRFTKSTESARRLILSALHIGRQTFTSPTCRAETPEEEMRYWWNVYRSIIFLECWFAYNTSHESRITPEDLTLYHPSRPHAEHDLGVFQERVSDLGQLAAYITLDLKTGTQPKAAQAKVHFEILNEWHRTLPPPMQLSQLSLANPLAMNWHSKRSLLQLHTLFLGLLIEPYRYGLINLGRYRLNNNGATMALHDLEALENVEQQCVLAARQSARVASLLQVDNLIRSRCWVSVYTSFTGCAVLLFSASQKLLKLVGEEVGQDLLYASSHLNVLSLCSYDNAIARKLYITLQIIFNDIREIVISPVYDRMRKLQIAVKNEALVPSSQYGVVDGAGELSKNILELIARVIDVLQESLSF